MATIIPFRGIVYNAEKINTLSDVVTPPYDVISDSDRQRYHKRHPQNIIRLILGDEDPADTHQDNWYLRAAKTLQQWRSDHFLVQDDVPTLYLIVLEFLYEGKLTTRYGFIGAVGLEPFEKKIVLPHEKTYSKIKSERFELMKACHANFGPIFSLYSDPDNLIIETLKTAASHQKPDIDFLDEQHQRHRMWRISDPKHNRRVSEMMADKRIFIADGHHRYETALNYQRWIAQHDPAFSAQHPANYVMMYLNAMEDPGLMILPAHRILRAINDATMSSLIEKLSPFFDIREIAFEGDGKDNAQNDLMAALRGGEQKNCLGMVQKGVPAFYLLSLKPGVMKQKFANSISLSLLDLDVTVLTQLILGEILGFDQTQLDDVNLIQYSSSEKEAIDAVTSQKWDIAFILNSTKIDQVRRIAEEGLIMPRKATYFYPKVITGLVIYDLT